MLRYVIFVLVLLVPAYLSIAKPRIFPTLFARLRYRESSRASLEDMQAPPWAIYYLHGAGDEEIPAEVKGVEDWVRTLGCIFLAAPLVILTLMILLS